MQNLKEAADSYKNRALVSSKQQEVYKMLSTQRVKFEKEKKLHYFMVDAFVDPGTVIEFDGKAHYYSDTNIIISKKLIKNSYLAKKGYSLVNISYKDWKSPEGRKKVIDSILYKLNMEERYVDTNTK